ncbi:MAG: hypothetical protein LBU27_00660 [Candidatus Peribacteria bacterium]|nr:hypothetical protein [Candidatus Peribacteria bacterium]
MKKKFLHNIVKFILGLLLLTLCFTYLQSHPAERISFFSGFKVIFQNAEIFFQNLFGKNGDLLKQKYSLESYYEALISLSEEKPCVEASLIKDLHTTYEKLLNEPKSTLNYTLNDYIHKQIEFDRALRVECKTPPSE